MLADLQEETVRSAMRESVVEMVTTKPPLVEALHRIARHSRQLQRHLRALVEALRHERKRATNQHREKPMHLGISHRLSHR